MSPSQAPCRRRGLPRVPIQDTAAASAPLAQASAALGGGRSRGEAARAEGARPRGPPTVRFVSAGSEEEPGRTGQRPGRRATGWGTVATRGGVGLRAEAWTGRAGDVDPCASAGERGPRNGGVPRPSAPVILTLALRDLGAAPPFPLSLLKRPEGCSDQGIGLSLREGHCLHF